MDNGIVLMRCAESLEIENCQDIYLRMNYQNCTEQKGKNGLNL